MNRKKAIILLILAVLVAAFFKFDLGKYFTLEALKANRDSLRGFYAAHPALTVSVFILIYVVQTALSLPGAAIMTLGGGAVFGALWGTLFANVGATAGAVLAFLVSRYLFRDFVQEKFGKRLAGINTELEKSGLNYLLFLRLVPLFPFFLINLGAGLTRMRLWTFYIGTVFGIIPGDFVYCNAGASLASINSLKGIASPRVLGSLALLGLFALIPVAYRKLSRRSGA